MLGPSAPFFCGAAAGVGIKSDYYHIICIIDEFEFVYNYHSFIYYFIILSFFFYNDKKQGAWIPIYPFDVIKTNIQNTQGDTTNR